MLMIVIVDLHRDAGSVPWYCRIEPYWIKEAPLRGTASGAPRAGLSLGRPARRARAVPCWMAPLIYRGLFAAQRWEAVFPASIVQVAELPTGAAWLRLHWTLRGFPRSGAAGRTARNGRPEANSQYSAVPAQVTQHRCKTTY